MNSTAEIGQAIALFQPRAIWRDCVTWLTLALAQPPPLA
jgi:hypothetical protein